MTKLALFVSIILAALIAASTVSAATRDPRVPALQRQVAALNARLAQAVQIINHNADVMDCNTAWYNEDWNVNWQLWSLLLNMMPPPLFDISDNGACTRIGRTPPSGVRTLAAHRSPFDTVIGLQAGAIVR
jgi:hypothetical protein